MCFEMIANIDKQQQHYLSSVTSGSLRLRHIAATWSDPQDDQHRRRQRRTRRLARHGDDGQAFNCDTTSI